MTTVNETDTDAQRTTLTAKQAHLIELLCSGVNIVGAARELKVDESTCRRWLKLPHVANAYETAKADLFNQVLAGLQKQSLKTLAKHINADVEPTPGSQIRAVALVFAEVLAREKVDELERKINELERILSPERYGGLS